MVQIPTLTAFQTFKLSCKLIFQAAPRYLWPLFLLTILTGISPSLSLYFNKQIINIVVDLSSNPVIDLRERLYSPLAPLFGLIVAIIALSFIVDAFKTINTFITASVRDTVKGYATLALIEKISTFPHISLFENTDLLNLIKLSEQGIRRLEEFSFIIIIGLGGFATLIPAIAFSLTISWWVPLVLLCTAVPSIYIEGYYREKSWFVEQSQANNARMMDIQATILTQSQYAKELRLLRLQSELTQRWQGYFEQTFHALQSIRRKGTFQIILWSSFNSLGLMIPYVFLIAGVLQKHYSIGDLALYGGLIIQVRQGLYMLINNGADLYDVILGTMPIHQLLSLNTVVDSSSFPEENIKTLSDRHQTTGIEFNNVTFTYPGQSRPIINHLNFQIHPGEVIAIVGENGAGKTTLIKLLCRFYDLRQGEILWNGININTLDYDDLYQRIAVIFQDYAQFPASLRENIAFGNLGLLSKDPALLTLLHQVGLNEAGRSLPLGLETPLGRALENGVELSGGQWQRVAIARALSRIETTELLIFDEPTAALDSQAEDQIFKLLKAISRDRMTVIISHRLALCRLADRILVMDQGNIIEAGSHQDLMAQRGRYYQMFSLQAAHYSG
ncbi:MAG: ABC transporter ATP-binding protein [Synechocystis sp.]